MKMNNSNQELSIKCGKTTNSFEELKLLCKKEADKLLKTFLNLSASAIFLKKKMEESVTI